MLLQSSFQKWMDTEVFPASLPLQLAFLKAFFAQMIFLATGVFSTVMAQSLFYEGFTDHRTMLLPFCTYFGMFSVRFMPGWLLPHSETKNEERRLLSKGKGENIGGTGQDLEQGGPSASPLPKPHLSRGVHQRAANNSYTEDADCAGGPKAKLFTDTPSCCEVELKCFRLEGFRGRFLAWLTPLRCLILLTVSDFFGMFYSCVGLQKAGSGLYQVIYSSVVCWAAMLSRIILHKKLSRGEWVGILVVSLGLCSSALGQVRGPKVSQFRLHELVLGIVFTLLGSFFHSLCYVLGETAGKLPDPPSPKKICSFVGTANSVLLVFYFAAYTIPKWDELVAQKVQAVGGHQSDIIFGLLVIWISQLLHSITYFQLLSSSGAVSTGLMQSIRATLVFGLSSFLYCGRQASQCYTVSRGIATLLVAVGITYYTNAKKKAATSSSAAGLQGPPSSQLKSGVIFSPSQAIKVV